MCYNSIKEVMNMQAEKQYAVLMKLLTSSFTSPASYVPDHQTKRRDDYAQKKAKRYERL